MAVFITGGKVTCEYIDTDRKPYRVIIAYGNEYERTSVVKK